MKLVDVPTVALSIRQPWTWLIANGYKSVENREWGTSQRGRILLHAGKTFDRAGYDWVRQTFPEIPLPFNFDRGGYVGVGRLDACLAPGDEGKYGATRFRDLNQFAHRILEATPLPFVIGNGRLGYYNVGDLVRRAIVEAVNAA